MTMQRPRLLDLFCGAGGAGHGYHLAGFHVTGVDVVRRQGLAPTVDFLRADALDVLDDLDFVRSFDAIHASPPCQTHTRAKHLRDAQGKGTSKLDLIQPVRERLQRAGVPYVIENVPGAPVRSDLLLCGSMFPALQVNGRQLRRHRMFESTAGLLSPGPCAHVGRPLGVYGSLDDAIPAGGQTCATVKDARQLMGMPWAGWAGLVEAIPPAFTECIGHQLLGQLGESTSASRLFSAVGV